MSDRDFWTGYMMGSSETINRNLKHCNKFCLVCEYYEACKNDDVLG